MNLQQTKLIGLTMKLDLKAKEYGMLCEKLELIKNQKISPNDEELLKLKEEFQKNYNEIVELKRQLIELDNMDINKEEINTKQAENNDTNTEKGLIIAKESWIIKIINKVKKFFKKV